MAERYVRMNILSSGGEKARATLDDLTARARMLGAEDPTLKINADDSDATKKIKDLQLKIQILNRERAEIAFETKGDEAVKAKLLDISSKLRKLNDYVASPKMKLSDADKTEAQLIKIKLLMDAIHDKTVDVKVKEQNTGGGLLAKLERAATSGIFGGGGGGGGEAGGTGGEGGVVSGGLSGGLGQALASGGPALYGPLAALLASLLPSAAGLGVGGLVGAGGVGISALFAGQGTKQLKLDQAAIGKAKTPQAQLTAQTQAQQDTQAFAPFISMTANLKTLLSPLMGIIAPFAKALTPMIAQLRQFEQAIGPQLSKMFMASLPFIKMFLSVMEQGGKALIPAFTQAMNTMVKSGALKTMTQALVLLITDGLVPFLKVLGPGMAASAVVFKATVLALDGILIGIGAVATFIARDLVLFGQSITDVGKVLYSIGRIIAALLSGNWKAMGNAVAALGNSFRNFFSTLGQMVLGGFTTVARFGHNVASVFDTIRHAVSSAWSATWDAVAGIFIKFYDWDQNLMGNFRHSIAGAFNNIRHDIARIWDATWSYISNRAKQNFDSDLNMLRNWGHNVATNFDSLRHTVAHSWDVMWSDVKSITSNAVRGVGNAIHGIEGAFRIPIAWVVDNVWDRLAGIWNKIAGIVHLSSLKLPVATFAEGGRVAIGSGPKSDDVLARVSKGETIVSAAHSQRLAPAFAAVGVPGYAAGGIPNPISAVKGIGKDLLGWAMKPLSFIISHLFGGVEHMLGGIPGVSPGMDSVMKSLSMSLITSLGKNAKSGAQQAYAGKYTGHYGSGVMQWQGDVFKALAMEGLGKYLASQVLYQMQTESGGNPNAINLTDSNAAAGDPSRGLLQTIMTTFRAYHWPGTSWDIYNPLANIAAAINYARHRYGPTLMSGGMGMGSGHGYWGGGWLTEPIIGRGLRTGQAYSLAEFGPEYVSPGGHGRGGPGGANYYINVTAAPLAHPADVGREVVHAIKQYEKRSGDSWRN